MPCRISWDAENYNVPLANQCDYSVCRKVRSVSKKCLEVDQSTVLGTSIDYLGPFHYDRVFLYFVLI